METYTSPSGNQYEIRPKVYTRSAGGILEGCEFYDVEETSYEVFHSGAFATFSLAEEGVAEAVSRFESPGGFDPGSRFD
jgi:hypothetical protein